jgi:hypothetical protein
LYRVFEITSRQTHRVVQQRFVERDGAENRSNFLYRVEGSRRVRLPTHHVKRLLKLIIDMYAVIFPYPANVQNLGRVVVEAARCCTTSSRRSCR